MDYETKRFGTEATLNLAERSLRGLKARRALDGVKNVECRRILDLGCGEGALTRTLRKSFPYAEIHGCDVSFSQLERAEKYGGNIIYRRIVDELPYERDYFDAVFVLDVLEHVDEPDKMVREIARVLRSGGKLLLHCPCEGQPGTLHWGYYKFNLGRDFKRELAGHVQHFMRSDVVRLMNNEGLACRRIRYTYHLWGQYFDLLTFWRIWCQQENGEKSGWLARFMVWLPWWRMMTTLEQIAYYESRLLGRLPLGMGMDACFEKENGREYNIL
jgi:ubiquinone/menaquinone biosynthesis C-methylase UbiE